ncbi:peptidase M56 BlaR1 [Paludibacter propionicigenes WB4]|uniref:Peptidase M56 BlaR1 n=2 Tax=Paludibacter TaxID=346096 RepID=E4T6J0_PALPW|nr:peptidase M56 BlaR1 [Paludibacter propionicigenes WB4]
MQELLALALPVGKYILAAILMVAFYWFLFREKATFNNCRMYLLSIALVAILISQFSIVVYTPPAQVVEIEATPTVTVMSNQPSSAMRPQTTTPTTASIAASTPAEKVTEPNKYLALLKVKNMVLVIYIAVTAVLFVLLFVQFFKILGLKRRGRLTTKDGFEVIESDEIPTPFSFYKTIFLSPNLTGTKLEMILKHEQWHIKHRHYVDVFIIEILVRLLWFNPVLWWVRRELRNVSEFHADRSVLDEGQDLYKYQTVILEEVMEKNPYLANGFNNSFTRKRFIMMKNKCHIRFTTLRRALYVPFLVLVFSLFSFTIGKGEVRYVEKQSEKSELNNKQELSNELPVAAKSTVNSKNDTLELVNKIINEYPEKLDIAIKKFMNIQKYDNLMIYFTDMKFILNTLEIQYDTKNEKLKPSMGGSSGVSSERLVGVINQLTESRKAIMDLKFTEAPNQKIDLLRRELGKIQENPVIKIIIRTISGDQTNNLSTISNTLTFAKLYPIIPPKENIVENNKSPFLKTIPLTDEQADKLLVIYSDELDKLIIRLDKLISEYSPQALREGLLSAVKMENERKTILRDIEPNSFCDEFYATISKEELEECLAAFKISKSNIEKIRKSDTKAKSLSDITSSLWNQKVQMKIMMEVSRIRGIGRNQIHYSPSEYYKNVKMTSANTK